MSNVLITGVSSGIGKAIKDEFIKNNFNVYGIDLAPVGNEYNFTFFQADITNEDKILDIKKFFDNNKISFDLIINVAGIHKMASLVESNYEDLKKVIDVNLLGTMLVNRSFHSLLNEKGRIIIVTSEVASYDPMPFNGLYNISKTALDCYAQALRQELNLINQKVITIRPGAVETPLSQSSILATENLVNNTKLYKKQSKHFLSLVTKFMGKPMKPNKMGRKIYKISIKKRPKLIYKIHQNIGLVMLSMLPKKMQCWIIKLLLNRK